MTKTMSFAVVHFTVAFTVGYLMTGSLLVGGAIALVEPAINTVAYYFHELVWSRFSNVDSESAASGHSHLLPIRSRQEVLQ